MTHLLRMVQTETVSMCQTDNYSSWPILGRKELFQPADNGVFMTVFDNILNVLLPDYPAHSVLDFADRFNSQHVPGFILALCTLRFQTKVGQAWIGTIDIGMLPGIDLRLTDRWRHGW